MTYNFRIRKGFVKRKMFEERKKWALTHWMNECIFPEGRNAKRKERQEASWVEHRTQAGEEKSVSEAAGGGDCSAEAQTPVEGSGTGSENNFQITNWNVCNIPLSLYHTFWK